jgi:ABC-type uncharacterized transport system substrate-binding protein
MLKIIKHLWLGLALIALTSGMLLFSDLGHRKTSANRQQREKLPQIAIMQISSARTMDDSITGIMEELRAQGYVDGKTAVIKRFNASGDYSTAATIAKDIVSGDYDVIITSGTPTLQTMASANREGKKIHVFGTVTDPYGSGVGITGSKPDQHPAHLVGIGTFQPVENTFEIARKMNPALKRVGTVWNPTEHNAEACVIKARAKCKALGIQLYEANAGNTTEVPEALRSLLTRDVEAIWVGGDIVTIASIPTIVETTRKLGIPVFTNTPTDVEQGALFGLGASYVEVGRITAKMACSILKGEKPTSMRVDNVVPEHLAINKETLSRFKGWNASEDLLTRSEASQNASKSASSPKPEAGRTYKVSFVYVTPHKLFDEAIKGAKEAFKENGFIEGKNLKTTIQHANGDLSILQQIVTNIASSDCDLVFVLSTPGLGAVAGRIKNKPVVFAEVTEPVGAGAGKSFTDHQANVTGSVAPAPLEGGFTWLMKLYPNIKRIGMIYTPSEPNVVTEVKIAQEFAKKYGFELVLKMANTPSEVPEAMTSVIAEGIDAFFYEGDNSIMSAEPVVIETCRRHKIPILADDDSEMGRGSLLACGVSPFGNGHFGGIIASRVLLGENPATIPFTPSTEEEISIDLSAAKELGLTFPEQLIKEASIIHGISSRYGRPAKIAVVNIGRSSSLDAAREGLEEAIGNSGLVKNKDYTIRDYNAQGDIALLPQMIDAAFADAPDAIITISTPAAVALANRKTSIPIVFTVCSAPDAIGITSSIREGRMTGVYEVTPVVELLQMARRRCPGLSKIGVLYNPSEVNSQVAMDALRESCKKSGIELIAKTVSNTSEIPDAARAIVTQGVGAILTSADNTVDTGIVALTKVANAKGIPVFATDPDLVKAGVAASIGNNYAKWGEASGHMLVKVLAGIKPASLPPESFKTLDEVEGDMPAAKVPALVEPKKHFAIAITALNDSPTAEESIQGAIDGLAKGGFKEGRDYTLRKYNAQGDMTTLAGIMTTIRATQPDLHICVSTPVLQGALNANLGVKNVFNCVADGVKAGAGKSETDHNPLFTGVTTRSMFEEMAATLHELLPHAKRIGTIYTPAEVNSVLYRELFTKELAKYDIELVSLPVSSQNEITDAVNGTIAKDVDAFCQIADNTSHSGYAFIAKRAIDSGLPFFAFETVYSKVGAILTLARDYYDAGVESGIVAAQILEGADPASIPFTNTKSKRLTIDMAAAKKAHLAIPSDLIAKADKVLNLGEATGRPMKVALINMADNKPLEESQKGVLLGLTDKGLVDGKDFVVKTYNGHGDYTLYPQILDNAQNENPDMIVLIGTPLIQTAAKKGLSVPAVFTVSSEPDSAGIGGAVRNGWLTGVYLNTPVEELVDMAIRRTPGIRKVGVIFNSGEFISNEAVKKMRAACRARGLALSERSVSSANEVTEATGALLADGVEAILTSCDSIMNAAMSAVSKATKPHGIPIYANELELAGNGATASIGYSFCDWGRAAGRMAALVLSGAKPTDLPPVALSRDFLREVEADAADVKTTGTATQPLPVAQMGPDGQWNIRIVAYADTQFVDEIRTGILDGLKSDGLVEGRDYKLRYYNAQGDIATLSSIMNGVRADDVDLLFDIATPVVQAGMRHAANIRQVFAGVADGVSAGAGRTDTDHAPFITGIASPSDFATMIGVIRETHPNAKRIGTLYAPAESNALFYKNAFEKLLAANGMELVCVPVTSSTEVGEAAATLCTKDIDLVCQILDNATHPAFAQIAKKARQAGLAAYSFNNSFMQDGATLVLSYDYHHTGEVAAAMGLRVLRGENPANIPFAKDQATSLLINREAARSLGITIPDSLAKRAVSM